MIHYGILNNGYVYHCKNKKGHQVLLLAWKSKMAKDAKKTKIYSVMYLGCYVFVFSKDY